MINEVVLIGIATIGLTAVALGSALVIIRIKRHRTKKEYSKLIQEKMNILTQLQEELKDREVSEETVTPISDLPPQAELPTEFFEQNYMEVKL